MNRHKLLALIAFFCLALGATSFFINIPVSHADDGIPANCESAATDEQRALFPRYEFNNQRIEMVSWTTGADALTLDTGLVADEVIFRDWTADCRFLLGAVIHNGVSDTVVWDALNGGRITTVTGARRTPHAYHLYADYHLIVETVNGGVLVNLATGSQMLMPAPWDEITNRNFRTRPTFNSAQGWIEVRLFDGEATAYNSTTGARIENYLELYTQIYQPEQVDSCLYSYRLSLTMPDHRAGYYVRYEAPQVILYHSGEVTRVLNENLETDQFYYRQFSDDCRYYVAHVQRPGERIYDTYVWDTTTGRQMIFEDARLVPHNFSFVAENRALIHTRNGGYLWNLVTDERVLLTEGVSLSDCYSRCTVINFTDTQVVNNQLWLTTVAQPNGVTVYDLDSGAQIGFYDAGSVRDARFTQLNDNWMLVYTVSRFDTPAPLQFGLWNLQSGEYHYLISNTIWGNFEVMSEDERYFVQATQNRREMGVFQIWDLHNLNEDRSPNFVVDVPYLQQNGYSRNEPTLTADGILTVNERVYNIFTGETLYIEDIQESIPANPIAISEGIDIETTALQFCDASDHIALVTQNERRVVNRNTGEIVARLGSVTPVPNGRTFGYIAGGRYLAVTADIRYSDAISLFFLWDACTFEPIELPFASTVFYQFDPSAERVLVAELSGYRWGAPSIWHIPTNQVMPLQADVNYIGIGDIYWDYARGRLMISADLTLRLFDMRTGQMLTYFEGQGAYENNAHPNSRSIGRTRIVNNQWAVLTGPIFSVFYNLDSFENFALRTDELPGPMAISPSGRYVVVKGTVLRVWDVTDQPVDLGDRHANFFFDVPSSYGTVYFIDETTIELTDIQHHTATRWNIRTGEQIRTD